MNQKPDSWAKKAKALQCEVFQLRFLVFLAILLLEISVAAKVDLVESFTLFATAVGSFLAAVTAVLNVFARFLSPLHRQQLTRKHLIFEVICLLLLAISVAWFFVDDAKTLAMWANVAIVINFFYGKPR